MSYDVAMDTNNVEMFKELYQNGRIASCDITHCAYGHHNREFLKLCCEYRFPICKKEAMTLIKDNMIEFVEWIQYYYNNMECFVPIISSLEMFKWFHNHGYSIKNYNYDNFYQSLDIIDYLYNICGPDDDIIDSMLEIAFQNKDIEKFNWVVSKGIDYQYALVYIKESDKKFWTEQINDLLNI